MKKMRILIAYDGSSHADAALDDLRRAGLPRQAEALVLSVADVWLWPPPKDDARGIRGEELDVAGLKRARALSEQAVEEARRLAVQASERIKSAFPLWKVDAEGCGDSPAWAVIKKADDWGADLVVVGSQGRSALGRLILGSVSQKVLYEARCSARVGRASSRADNSPPRIIIGVDGSPGAEAAVSAAAGRDWPGGTEARVIAVHSPQTLLAIGHFIQPVLVAAREHADDRTALAQSIADLSAEKLRAAGLAVTAIAIEGDPKRVLLDEAEKWEADCIFVGARGLRRIQRLLLGSVSGGVAAQANCSVEVVRMPEA
ncbi:MAG TPA: universal stress protein [Blastocatellia bacterium]|jgi:nucleotide-binding universal stress UspA family protein